MQQGTAMHKLFYIPYDKPGRKWRKIINPIALNELTALGLAVWYCDDGTYCVRDKSCALSTQGFSYEENHIIKNYFLRYWGINASVTKDYRSNIPKMYYKLTFNTRETQKFLKVIKDYIPRSMFYKLGYLSEKNYPFLVNETARYLALRKKWYYENHERALQRASRYRCAHRKLVNSKRVLHYWNNLERSRVAGRKSMEKRRLFNKERVNSINRNYYVRNKDRINQKRRERLVFLRIGRELTGCEEYITEESRS